MENQTQKRVIRKIAVHIEADPSLPEIVFNSQPVEFVLQATNPDEMEKQTNELRRKLRKNLVIMLTDYKDFSPAENHKNKPNGSN